MLPRKRLAVGRYGLHRARDVGYRSHFDLASQDQILPGDAGFEEGATDRSPGEFTGLSFEPGSHGFHLRGDFGVLDLEAVGGVEMVRSGVLARSA